VLSAESGTRMRVLLSRETSGGKESAMATITSGAPARAKEGSALRERLASRSLWRTVAMYLALILVCILVLFPIYWMITISLKSARDIYRVPSLIPHTTTLDNYRQLLEKKHFLTNIRNGLIVSASATVVSVFIAFMAAYSLVRMKYRWRGAIGKLILLSYLTPASLLFIPLSVIVARLHLGNSLHGLIMVYLSFSTPFSTWLLMGYFKGIPTDLEEQAMVDGTTRLGAMVRILLPLTAPGLVAVSIFTFTGAWNELLLALIFITSEDKRTVPLGLQYLITGDVLPWGPIMAGAVLSALPVMVLYFLAQRFMVQGLAAGAVKG
jgi:multiple sugar transport system permease protein